MLLYYYTRDNTTNTTTITTFDFLLTSVLFQIYSKLDHVLTCNQPTNHPIYACQLALAGSSS